MWIRLVYSDDLLIRHVRAQLAIGMLVFVGAKKEQPTQRNVNSNQPSLAPFFKFVFKKDGRMY